VRKPKAYIIGQAGNHRNPMLKEQIAPWFEVVEDNGFVDSLSLKGNLDNFVDLPLFESIIFRNPSRSEVACFLAHLQAWAWLLESGDDYLMIFEDDARLILGDLSHLVSHLEELRGPWQVSLERREGDFLVSHSFGTTPSIRRSLIQPRGAGAYAISKEAARIGIEEWKSAGRIKGVADLAPGPSRFFRYFIHLPPIFDSSTITYSYIGERSPKDFSLRVRFYKVLKVVFSKDRRLYERFAFSLKMLRFAKYLGSIHFWTTWYIRRRKGNL
jgi:hypothetical protein